MEKQIDILAIGDIATEPFIQISDAKENCDDEGNCNLCFRFGDKIPYDSAEVCYAVGNSSNVAISSSRLGLNTYLVSYVGDDIDGKENISSLIMENVKTDFIEIVKGYKTNYHYVLWFKTERTILVNHTEFPYSLPANLLEPKWIYFSSLAHNSLDYHYQILEYLKIHPDVKLAFQPGTFQMKLGLEKLKDIYLRTNIFLCNKEEYQRILEMKEEQDCLILMKKMHDFGPKVVVLTDGLNGAYAYDGLNAWHIPVYSDDSYERTGAGDAFSSAFVAAINLGKDIPEALLWGSLNAKSVVSYVGPHKGLLTIEQLEKTISEINPDYKAVEIS